MKASELMIGDWVHSTTLKKVFRVTCLDDDHDEIKTSSCHIPMKLLEPIPLTEELLLKNGFDRFRYDGWVHYYKVNGNGALPFVIHSMIGGEMLSDEVESFSTSTENDCGIQMNYVHELQHALRLCCRNDLADNFKIA